MTGHEIVSRAESLCNCAYWYGGKRQLASKALADTLKAANPSVWTASYYATALRDIDGQTHVCDCSGLVCYAYNITDIGSYTIRDKFKVWTAEPKAGMIGWKKGHVGIFSRDGWDAPIIEMRSQNYDFMESRTFKECGFSKVLYSESVQYGDTENPEEAIGWHADENGWWYRHTKGTGKDTYYHDTQMFINGHMYLFDSEGYIITYARVSPNSKEGWLY